jgi:hypothetical protein
MCEVGQALNKLAREQMKLRLMQDIRVDIEVCKLEGINYKDYLLELKDMIDGFLREKEGKT